MKNKITLVVILVLLICSISLGTYGYIVKLNTVKEEIPENINKEFKFYGSLYFYDNEELLGTYKCNYDTCDYASTMIDDNNYSLNYYKEATEEKIELINKRYAFINDSKTNNKDEIILYDVINQNVVSTLSGIKNYSIGIDNDYIIVRNHDNKWGVMKMSGNAGLIIDYQYDFIGLINNINSESNKIISNHFIVKDLNGWKIISPSNIDESTYFVNQINDYNANFVITKNGDYYFLNSLTGNLLTTYTILGMEFVSKYVKIYSSTNEVYLIDPNTLQDVSRRYNATNIDEIQTTITLNGIEIYQNNTLQEIVS